MTPHHPEYGQPALFVDGAWIAETPNMGQVSNPATGKILAAFPMADAAHVERALNAAEAAFPIWSGMSLLDRSAILHKAAAELRKDAETAARHLFAYSILYLLALFAALLVGNAPVIGV